MSMLEKAPATTITLILAGVLLTPWMFKHEITHYRLAHAASLPDRVAIGIEAVRDATTQPSKFTLHTVKVNNLTGMMCFEFEGWSMFGLAPSTAMISKSGDMFIHHDRPFADRWQNECTKNLTTVREDHPIQSAKRK